MTALLLGYQQEEFCIILKPSPKLWIHNLPHYGWESLRNLDNLQNLIILKKVAFIIELYGFI